METLSQQSFASNKDNNAMSLPIFTAAHTASVVMKAIKDKLCKPKDTIHQKRWHVLNSENHLAFKDWEEKT